MITEELRPQVLGTWADALTTRIEDRQRLAEQQELYDGFHTQCDAVARLLEPLERSVTTWCVFFARGLVTKAALPEARAARHQVQALSAAFAESPATIVGPQRMNGLRSAVARVTAALNDQVLEAWTEFATGRIPNVNDEVLTVLARIPSLQHQVARVRDGRRSLLASASIPPAGATDAEITAAIDDFERRAASVTAAWELFDTEPLSAEVLQFLRLAGGPAGAPIGSLTRSVQNWLQENDLTSSFAVRAVLASHGGLQ